MDNGRSPSALASPIPPPRHRRRVIWVLRPRPGNDLRGICLNQELAAIETLWDNAVDGKVRACKVDPEAYLPQRPRWYGYMPVLSLQSGRISCLEVTHAAAAECKQLSTERVPLRGLVLTVGRHGRGKFGHCFARIEPYHAPILLPPAEDLEPLLDMIFEDAESGTDHRFRAKPSRRERGE